MAVDANGVEIPESGAGTPPVIVPEVKTLKTFTQEQLDAIVQERLSKPKQQLEQTQKLLDDFKKNKTITEEQQTQLQAQIDNLTKQVLTKEQLSAKEKKELSDQASAALKEANEKLSTWKNRYESSTIERSIVDAAVANEGFNPNHFISILGPLTTLIEEVVEGKPTGRLVPTVTFQGQDKDGKPVQMTLSPQDAVKEMKKMTGTYGNFFKSGLNPGVGGTNTGGTGNEITDESVASFDAWKAKREEIKAKF